MRPLTDWDAEVEAIDFETSGTRKEYALQPWRLRSHDFWATSLASVRKAPDLTAFGGLAPDRTMMRSMLEDARDSGRRLLCWNAPFDISVFIAYGFEDLVMQIDWLDGMLIWKHVFIEPEYEMDRSKKKSYGLKTAVEEFLPQYAGYADDVDFHNPDPEERKKTHQYNIRDNAFTWQITKHLWEQLNERQRMTALIEADCLPLVAQANFYGMTIDRLQAKWLEAKLTRTADEQLVKLRDHVIDTPLVKARDLKKLPTEKDAIEAIVRSPTKLATLLYDYWQLPVLKENEGKKTGKITRATDKEVLHELTFMDPRAKIVREYREALNNRKKFATTPLIASAYNGDDKAHPLANVFGTYTSRLTYSSKQTNKTKRKEAPEPEDAD